MSKIKAQPYEIDAEDAVELIGRNFKFTHYKGLVEWIKNSWDAYQRHPERMTDGLPTIILEFTGSGKSFREVRVTDFCGMTKDDIDGAFKRWFDMQAATKGASGSRDQILGGHGNGGKFYMRQMFRESRILTWFNGRMSAFGFNEKKEYGFVEGVENIEIDLESALDRAQLNAAMIPDSILEQLKAGRIGFTVVWGVKAEGEGVQVQSGHVLQGLQDQPQMSALLDRVSLSVWANGEQWRERLTPNRPDPHPGFNVTSVDLPGVLKDDDQEFTFGSSDDEVPGVLTISVCDRALTGRLKTHNRLDAVGTFGVVASYPLEELPLSHLEGSEFLHALLTVPSIERGENPLVENARERLIPSPKTSALLRWVSQQLDSVAKRIAQHNATERRKVQAAETAKLTKLLNKYARQFLNDFYTEVLGGPGEGSGSGGSGGGGGPAHADGSGKRSGKGTGGDAGTGGGGSGDQKTRVRKFPQVLVAGVDPDPFAASGETLVLTERHPTLYQRAPQDVEARIYWINMQAPYAQAILDSCGENSATWKNYVLIRHRDVVVKEALRHMTEREGLDLSLENVNNRIDELTDNFLNSLDQSIADSMMKGSQDT